MTLLHNPPLPPSPCVRARSICRQADRLASAWDAALAARGGAPLRADVATDMQRLTLDIVGAVAFSHDFRQVDLVRTTHLRGCAAPADAAASNAPAPSDRLLENINAAQEVMGRLFVTPAPLLRAFRALRLPFMVAMDAAFEEMRLSMAGVIARRREAVARGERSGDLLDALLLAEDPVTGQRLSDHELWEDVRPLLCSFLPLLPLCACAWCWKMILSNAARLNKVLALTHSLSLLVNAFFLLRSRHHHAQVHDVMGAGHETTASTLTACLYSLSQHPHVQRRLQEELDVALQGAPPTWEAAQSGRLWYAEAVVKEALRLYPPIALFPRVAERADVLPSGHAVEAGEVVFMSAYAMGRSEATWGPTVLQFDPLRFAREAEARRHRFAYLPFGAGPRACMGGSFALMSTTLVLARLAQRYSFRSLEPRGEARARCRGASRASPLLASAAAAVCLCAAPVDRAAMTTEASPLVLRLLLCPLQIFPTQYDITLNFPGGVPMEITLRADGPEESASIQAVADDDAAAP